MYVQVRQVVTTAMVVSAMRGQIHLFTKDPKDKIHDTSNYIQLNISSRYPSHQLNGVEDDVVSVQFLNLIRS